MIQSVKVQPKPREPARFGQRSFAAEGAEVAARLKAAVRAVIDGLPGRVGGGTDLGRELRIGSTAAWRIYSFASEAQPMAALQLLPGRATMMRLTQAAERRGVGAALTRDVLAAYDQFEAFMREHAGDRTTLDTLLRGVGAEESGAINLNQRRGAFRLNASIWGIQARTGLGCVMCHEVSKGVIDSAYLAGYVRAHPLRRDVPLQLKRRSAIDHAPLDGLPPKDEIRLPEDIQLLSEFCSKPLPQLTTSRSEDGSLEINTTFRGVGKGASVDCFVLETAQNVNDGRAEREFVLDKLVTIPLESLVLDLLVPRGMVDPATVQVSVRGNPGAIQSVFGARSVLPVKEVSAYLGADLSALRTPEVPRYPEMARSVVDRLGWQHGTMDIFRCHVKYPILHAVVRLQVDAPTP